MDRDPQDLPTDLLRVAEALQEHRPRLNDTELARAKRRATGRGTGTAALAHRSNPGGFMKSRLALTAVLALGALMSMGGAAFGVSALSSGTTAGSAQYGTPPPCTTPGGTNPDGTPCSGTAPKTKCDDTNGSGASPDSSGRCGSVLGGRAGGGGSDPADVAGAQDTAPAAAQAAPAPSATEPAAQAPRQVQAANDDQLPFTGYAAIPMLLIGIALLGGGMVLRRSTRSVS